MPEPDRLQQVLTDWQQRDALQEVPAIVKTFTAGLNHETHLVKTGQLLRVLKLFTEPQPAAIKTQQWAAFLAIAPEIVDHSAGYDIAVFDYIDTPSLAETALINDHLAPLGEALQTLHRTPADDLQQELGDFNLTGFCERYLAEIQNGRALYQDMHERLQPVLDVFLNDPSPWCLCHNDLVAANCFVGPDGAMFIDWEYAQRHNPWFDLAGIIYYLRLNDQQIKTLIDAYDPDWSELTDQPIVTAAQCAILWGDMLWHLARGGREAWPDMGQKLSDLVELTATLEVELVV